MIITKRHACMQQFDPEGGNIESDIGRINGLYLLMPKLYLKSTLLTFLRLMNTVFSFFKINFVTYDMFVYVSFITVCVWLQHAEHGPKGELLEGALHHILLSNLQVNRYQIVSPSRFDQNWFEYYRDQLLRGFTSQLLQLKSYLVFNMTIYPFDTIGVQMLVLL